MSSNFYQLYLHYKTCVVLANLPRNICKNRIENWTFVDLVILIGMHVLLNFFYSNIYILLIVFTIECRVVINIQTHRPISLKNVSL